MRFRKAALIAAAVMAAAASGPAAFADKAAPAKSPPQQCFYTRMIDGFAAPDDENLYIRVGMRDVYHLTLLGHCQDLDWDQRVALISRTGGGFICDKLDVEVETHARGLGRQRCAVTALEKLTPEQVAALPKHAKP